MRCREDTDVSQLAFDLSCEYVNFCNAVNLISEKFHTHSSIRIVGRINFQGITTNAEGTSVKIHFIAGILNIYKLPDHFISILIHAWTKRNHHVLKFLGRTQTIDAGNRRDDDNVLAF